MRILFLLRQRVGGMATHARDLQLGLEERGIHADILHAEDWIPNETGGGHDRGVTKKLRAAAKNYDLVHAFGYRSAWACSEAFGHKEAWVYTAFDLPKTTHRLLISHLNDAAAGLCASRAVFRELDEAIAIDLTTLIPGVRAVPDDRPTKEQARKAHGLPASAVVIGGLGRLVKERSFRTLIEAMSAVWASFPDAVLAIGGDGPERAALEEQRAATHRPDQIRTFGPVEDAFCFLAALDLLLVPSARAGFSMTALEAMALGVPVMLRSTGGLIELVEPDISGFMFRSDEELGTHIAEVLDLPLTLQTVGAAGRIRATETFAPEPCLAGLVEVYEGILSGD